MDDLRKGFAASIAQNRARNAQMVRSETVTFRLDGRLKALGEVAARLQGRKLSNFLECVLERAFHDVIVDGKQREVTPGHKPANQAELGAPDSFGGITLAQIADELWSPDEATFFYNRAMMTPGAFSEGELKLWNVLWHSDHYAPEREVSLERVKVDWQPNLVAIRDGEAEVDILPKSFQPKGELKFGLLSGNQRIELYKSDPVRFKRESEAYMVARKGY